MGQAIEVVAPEGVGIDRCIAGANKALGTHRSEADYTDVQASKLRLLAALDWLGVR
jgi:hypothetical protein